MSKPFHAVEPATYYTVRFLTTRGERFTAPRAFIGEDVNSMREELACFGSFTESSSRKRVIGFATAKAS